MEPFEIERDTTPALIPNRFADSLSSYDFTSLMGKLDHAHELETGKCIKNRFGPKCNVDPFLRIEGETPHTVQAEFVDAVTNVVDVWLARWGKASGKTKARLFLARAIINGDN
jgi:hypothetical protein